MTDNRAQVLLAQNSDLSWADSLAAQLQAVPVDLHRSRSEFEAIDLVAARIMHLAVVDGALPGGGINLVRRVRNMGMNLPTLLVCEQPDQRLLQDALALNVFSVVTPESPNNIASVVFRVFRQLYQFTWADSAN